jgi:hypothetical protein
MRYHYTFEAVRLLQNSIEQVQEVIEHDEQPKDQDCASTSSLYDMKEALIQVEQALHVFVALSVEDELASAQTGVAPGLLIQQQPEQDKGCLDLASSIATLRSILQVSDAHATSSSSSTAVGHARYSSDPHSYYTSRSVTDSLLFRLIVLLQLCLLRIGDARFVICGSRYRFSQPYYKPGSWTSYFMTFGIPTLVNCVAGSFGLAASALVLGQRRPMFLANDRIDRYLERNRGWIIPVAKASVSIVVAKWLHTKWGHLWMSTKLTRSTESLEAWCRQWALFMDHKTRARPRSRSVCLDESDREQRMEETAAVDSARNQRLIEYALNETPKVRYALRLDLHYTHLHIYYADNVLAISRRTAVLDDQTSYGCVLRFRRNGNRHYGTRFQCKPRR